MSSNVNHIEKAKKNRECILISAAELMSRQGYAATSIAAICKAACVEPPTLYWHFGNKESLAIAAMEHGAEEWLSFLPSEGVPIEDWPKALNAMFVERPDFLRLLLLLLLERRDPDDQVRSAAIRIRERIKKSWKRGLRIWLSPIDDEKSLIAAIDLLSSFVSVQIDGIFLASQLHPNSSDVDALIRLMGTGSLAAAQSLVRQHNRDRVCGSDRFEVGEVE